MKKLSFFQTIICFISNAAEEEIWAQQQKDWHRCKNGTNATAVEKVDKQIKELYNQGDTVLQ